MASYKTDLRWLAEISNFSDEEQKILLALSHDKYKWRTKERLASNTGLSIKQVDSILANLIQKGYVRPSFSKNKNLIYGLRERVG